MKETGKCRVLYERLRRNQARRYARKQKACPDAHGLSGLSMASFPTNSVWLHDLVSGEASRVFSAMTGLTPDAYLTFLNALESIPIKRSLWYSKEESALDQWRLWIAEVAAILVSATEPEADVKVARLAEWIRQFVHTWDRAILDGILPMANVVAGENNVMTVLTLMCHQGSELAPLLGAATERRIRW